jgi:hypothetical protein
MSVCPAVPCDVMPAAVERAGWGLLGRAGIVAVRVADLGWPARAGLGKDARTALVAAGGDRSAPPSGSFDGLASSLEQAPRRLGRGQPAQPMRMQTIRQVQHRISPVQIPDRGAR